MVKDPLLRLLCAGTLTGIADGTFSGVLAAVFYGSTVGRLFHGVAFTLLGKGALDGGMRTARIGVLMHFGVAFGWSAVFLVIAMRSSWLRQQLVTTAGVVRVAAVYGPFIWLVMSLVVIPVLRKHSTSFTARWWIQFVGHLPFVGLPLVWNIACGIPNLTRASPVTA